jgi:hypothetical protein
MTRTIAIRLRKQTNKSIQEKLQDINIAIPLGMVTAGGGRGRMAVLVQVAHVEIDRYFAFLEYDSHIFVPHQKIIMGCIVFLSCQIETIVLTQLR